MTHERTALTRPYLQSLSSAPSVVPQSQRWSPLSPLSPYSDVPAHADLQFLDLDIEFSSLSGGLHLLEQDAMYVSIPTFLYTCLTFCARYVKMDGLRRVYVFSWPQIGAR